MKEKSRKGDELWEMKRRQICRGAMKILRKKKFHAASMREIARATGMSLGNLYNYLEKKEDILVLLYEDLMGRVRERLDYVLSRHDHPADQLEGAIRSLYDLACSLKDETLVILTEARSLRKRDLQDLLRKESAIVAVFESIIEAGVEQGYFRCAQPGLLANMISFNLWIVPLRGWNILGRNSEAEVLDQIIGCFMRELGFST